MSAARFGIATGAFEHERDDWDAAVAKAAAGGWRCLELTAITEERLDALVPFLRTSPAALEPFARVSLHAPVRLRTSLPAVVETLVSLDHGFDVVLHPDMYRAEPSLDRLGSRLVFENMDVQKSFGRGVDDLRSVLDTHPGAGLCLDVAHVWTNDPTLRLGRPTTAADLELYEPVLARCEHVPWLLEAELA